MRFTNLTRANEIGANSYLLEIGGHQVLLDCGMHPRLDGDAATPALQLLPPHLDAAILTHAHLDHAGALPVLRRRHPETQVFMTAPTEQLIEVLLHNSANVMQRRHEESAGAALPSFTHREVDLAARLWRQVPLGQPWSLRGERLAEHGEEPASFEFVSAGHILGSAAVLLREGERRVLYTGDICLEDQTVTRAGRLPAEPIDVLIVETTRGDYERPPDFRRVAEETRFGAAIGTALQRGAVLIPVFALGKTQEVLAMFLRFFDTGLIPRGTPVYIGGLSSRVTEIHDGFANSGEFQPKHSDLLRRLAPSRILGSEAEAHLVRPGCIYALSSGMMTPGTLSHTFARRMLGQPQHSIFFVGYADPHSPAGHLKAADDGELVTLGETIPAQRRHCTIDRFDFSAHAHRESVCEYVRRVQPKTVLLVHGDTGALEWFRARLSQDLPASEIIVPEPGRTYELA